MRVLVINAGRNENIKNCIETLREQIGTDNVEVIEYGWEKRPGHQDTFPVENTLELQTITSAAKPAVSGGHYDLLLISGGHGDAYVTDEPGGFYRGQLNSLTPEGAEHLLEYLTDRGARFKDILLGCCYSAAYQDDFKALLGDAHGTILSFTTLATSNLSSLALDLAQGERPDLDSLLTNGLVLTMTRIETIRSTNTDITGSPRSLLPVQQYFYSKYYDLAWFLNTMDQVANFMSCANIEYVHNLGSILELMEKQKKEISTWGISDEYKFKLISSIELCQRRLNSVLDDFIKHPAITSLFNSDKEHTNGDEIERLIKLIGRSDNAAAKAVLEELQQNVNEYNQGDELALLKNTFTELNDIFKHTKQVALYKYLQENHAAIELIKDPLLLPAIESSLVIYSNDSIYVTNPRPLSLPADVNQVSDSNEEILGQVELIARIIQSINGKGTEVVRTSILDLAQKYADLVYFNSPAQALPVTDTPYLMPVTPANDKGKILFFLNEQERLSHPAATKISKGLWVELFQSELYGWEQELQGNLSPMVDLRLVNSINNGLLRYWVYFVLYNPEANDTQLRELATRLQMPDTLLSWAAAMTGRETLLRQLAVNDREFSGYCYDLMELSVNEGQIDVFNCLVELFPDKTTALPSGHTGVLYNLFTNSARYGHRNIMERLVELFPEKLREMLLNSNFDAFRNAAREGSLDTMNYIIERIIDVEPDQLVPMLSSSNFQAFHDAAKSDNSDEKINRLLQFPAVLAHVEKNLDLQYGETFIHPFLAKIIDEFRNQCRVLEADNPDATFNLTNREDIIYAFYAVRSLIRRDDPAQLDNLRFLLAVPAVRAIAHTGVSESAENELLRLAFFSANNEAADLLLQIPAVNELAREHHYYASEMDEKVDLRAQASNPESASLEALSLSQQKTILNAQRHYSAEIKAMGGIQHVLEHLRQFLRVSYESNPAVITLANGQQQKLPLTMPEFLALNLPAEDKEKALIAYYQHKEHSALRYLTIPNPWISPEASFTRENIQTGERWAEFEQFIPLIAILWVGLIDPKITPAHGFTNEALINNFITELSLLARAHNWDSTREVANEQGVMYREEFDDLKPDKPSCQPGVPKRLLNAVVGHPHLEVLTLTKLDEELREFAHNYFSVRLNATNIDSVKAAWNNLVELEAGPDDLALLKTFDITADAQSEFMHYLREKYGKAFAGDMRFKHHIEARLELPNNDWSHLSKLANLLAIDKLFENQPTVQLKAPGYASMFNDRDIAACSTGSSSVSHEVIENKKI